MALSDGLVGLWSPFLGSSGYRLLDRSGRGSHGVLETFDAGTDWVGASVKGRSGYALDFDGDTDIVTFPTPNISFGASASFTMWLRLRNATPSLQSRTGLLRTNSGENTHYPWVDGTAYFKIFRTNRVNGIDLSASVDRKQWHLLSVTANAEKYIVRQNEIVVSDVAGQAINFDPYSFSISDSSGYYLDGQVAECCLFSVALTQSEIIELWRSGPGWYTRRSLKTYGFVPAAAGITGDLSATLASLTLSATGTLAAGASGSVTRTLDNTTLSSTGTLTAGASGTVSRTLDNVTLSSTGGAAGTVTGSVSSTLAAATCSSSGTLAAGLSGTVVRTLDAVTSSATGTLTNGASGTVTQTLANTTLASGGSLSAGLTAQVNQALEACVVSSTGTVAAGTTGVLSVQLASVVLVASGSEVLPGGFRLNVAGTWKDATAFIKVGDWKQATPFIKVNGVWK